MMRNKRKIWFAALLALALVTSLILTGALVAQDGAEEAGQSSNGPETAVQSETVIDPAAGAAQQNGVAPAQEPAAFVPGESAGDVPAETVMEPAIAPEAAAASQNGPAAPVTDAPFVAGGSAGEMAGAPQAEAVAPASSTELQNNVPAAP